MRPLPSRCSRARNQLHRTALTVGIVLLLILPVVFADTAAEILGGMAAVLFNTTLAWIPGLVLTIVGVLAESRAKRAKREDWATAIVLADHAEQLLQRPSAGATPRAP